MVSRGGSLISALVEVVNRFANLLGGRDGIKVMRQVDVVVLIRLGITIEASGRSALVCLGEFVTSTGIVPQRVSVTFTGSTLQALQMVSQLITVGWLVTILTSLNTVDIDVVNIDVLITNVIRNGNFDWLTVMTNQLTWNHCLFRRVVAIISCWTLDSISVLVGAPGELWLTVLQDRGASNGIDNLSSGEVIRLLIILSSWLTLLSPITVNVVDRLRDICRILSRSRLLIMDQVNRDVLWGSAKGAWQDVITKAICLCGIQLITLGDPAVPNLFILSGRGP